MTVPIAGYSHIAICVTDVERARTFYGQTLGLPELPRPMVNIPGAWFQVGSLQLHLIGGQDPPQTDDPSRRIGPHIALHIPADRFHATVEDLAARGVNVVRRPSQRPDDGVWAAFCQDPDGNLIELTDMGPMS